MSMIFELKLKPSTRTKYIKGACAMCGTAVYEADVTLSDAYAVYLGKCPNCSALNYLDFRKALRGYSSSEMYLCLPTEEEKKLNNLPADCPTKEAA